MRYKLTLEELQLFFKHLEALPAKVAGFKGVGMLLDQVAQFQDEAARLLEADSPTLELVESCIELGEELEIELTEVEQLRARADQLAWLEELSELLSQDKKVRSLFRIARFPSCQ